MVSSHLGKEGRLTARERIDSLLDPQDIIDPMETRESLVGVLEVLRSSKDQGMGRHFLANWPTKF